MIKVKNIIFRIVNRDFSKYLEIKYLIFSLAAKIYLYESVEIRVLRKVLKKGDLVVDGGANLGIYSKIMAHLVGEKGLVLSFEPLSFLCVYIKEKIKSDNVRVIQKALSDENKQIKIYIPFIGNGLLEPALASLEPLKMPALEQIVDCVKLDNQTNEDRKVSFIKIDLEGHEMTALLGSERILRIDRPIVQFEENQMIEKKEKWFNFATAYNYQILDIRTRLRKSRKNYYLVPNEKAINFINNSIKGFQVKVISDVK